MAARLVLLGIVPLVDPTESRYAEMARVMAATGDWVTPWIAPGVPFWGKPPLSMWMSAGSMGLFGAAEFAARLPHWLVGGLVAWLVWSWLAARSRREAGLAVALLVGSALFYVSAGAVMTDMALALGLMLVMRGFWLSLHGPPDARPREQVLLFAGLAIGLLAKGPITLMAIAPIAAWTIAFRQSRRALREIRWIAGALGVAAVVVPWFVVAEMRTPGFLEYFLVGEHWRRFVDPGWGGDLYGHSHAFPRGTIWLFAILAFLPWSFVLPVLAWKGRRVTIALATGDRRLLAYLLLWALTPCLVFTMAGNILWTYVLPALPALAMAAAIVLARAPEKVVPERHVAAGVAATAVVSVAIVAAFNLSGWDDRRSLKALVRDHMERRQDERTLVFFRKLPYSGAFYSKGDAELATTSEALAERLAEGPAYVVLRERHRKRLPDALLGELRLVERKGEYAVYRGGAEQAQESRVAAKRASEASASR